MCGVCRSGLPVAVHKCAVRRNVRDPKNIVSVRPDVIRRAFSLAYITFTALANNKPTGHNINNNNSSHVLTLLAIIPIEINGDNFSCCVPRNDLEHRSEHRQSARRPEEHERARLDVESADAVDAVRGCADSQFKNVRARTDGDKTYFCIPAGFVGARSVCSSQTLFALCFCAQCVQRSGFSISFKCPIEHITAISFYLLSVVLVFIFFTFISVRPNVSQRFVRSFRALAY